jgi:hypothetical protein
VGRVGAGKGSEILLYVAEVMESDAGSAIEQRWSVGPGPLWLPRAANTRKEGSVIQSRPA